MTLLGLPVAAQTPPDAGALQQQIERERQTPAPSRPAAGQPAAEAEQAPGGPTLTVREFRFSGNTLIPAGKLAPVVAGFLGRPLDFGQLQTAAMAVANAYRKAGWIVRAYLPRQDIRDGIVTIQIVEAVLGKLIPEGSLARIPATTVLSRFGSLEQRAGPLNARALDRSLLIADDLPGVAVSGALRPGAKAGETDLVLKLIDEPLVTGRVDLDNTGARSTGAYRLIGSASLNSPFGLGDQLSVLILLSEGSHYLQSRGSLPIGAGGWRMGFHASQLGYRLITPEFDALRARGDATLLGLDASYPIIRARAGNLSLELAADHSSFDNRTVAGRSSHYTIESASARLSANLYDEFLGGGANSAVLALARGRLGFGTLDPGEDPVLAGEFHTIRYSASRLQRITADLSLLAALSGQWSNDNLDSAEKFYLGGAYGVRAYPANEAGGARGQIANLELRWRLPAGFALTGFHDWGQITQTVDHRILPSGPNHYTLRGHGASLGWQSPFNLQLRLIWARRDGANPNRTIAGRDQDGSLERNRWWFTASLPF